MHSTESKHPGVTAKAAQAGAIAAKAAKAGSSCLGLHALPLPLCSSLHHARCVQPGPSLASAATAPLLHCRPFNYPQQTPTDGFCGPRNADNTAMLCSTALCHAASVLCCADDWAPLCPLQASPQWLSTVKATVAPAMSRWLTRPSALVRPLPGRAT